MTHRRILLALIVSGGGCQAVESDNILTSGMSASFSAVANGTGSTSLSARLMLEDGADYIDLEGDDRLVAWQGTNERQMSESNILNIITYSAEFGIDAADTIFRIELRRTVDEGAPSSTVRMPSPFDFTAFPSGTVSRTADVTVTWSPSGADDAMSWSARGDCIEGAQGTITGDPGTLTIGAGTLVKREPANAGDPPIADSCLVTVTVSRTTEGVIDPAFEEGGSFSAIQTRTTQYTSAP